MKVVVNFDLCQSNALCQGAAPDVFEVRDDGYLYVLIEEPDETRREAVEEAARLCPTQAITIEGVSLPTAATQRITIVGGSLAGLRSAEALRREGFEGDVTIVGAEPHMPYDRPPLSKQVLAGQWDPAQTALRGGSEVDATWVLGRRAVGLDAATRTLTLDDGSAYASDGIVLATGASPRTIAGLQPRREGGLDGVFMLRTLDDSLALRDALDGGPRVVVVGAGFIGSEVASTCRSRGLDVTVLEALPVPLERALGAQMGAVCGRLHAAHGTSLLTGAGVDGVEGRDRVEAVRLRDGRLIDADVVVVGVGVAPETGWLAGSGLTLDNGVVCDAWCEAAPGIVAAGDVARWDNPLYGVSMRVEHWANAAEQAEAAARTLVRGREAPPYAPVPYFWSDQYGTKIQFVGHASGDDEVAVLEGEVEGGRFVAGYGRAGRLVGALAVNRPARIPHYKALIAQRSVFAPPSPM